MRGEVPKEWCFIAEAHAGDLLAILPNLENDFDYVIDVALCVNASWYCEPHQVHLRSGGEHQGADFYRADSTFEIQLGCKCHSRKFIRRDVRQESTRIKIDSVSARRLHDRHALARDVVAE